MAQVYSNPKRANDPHALPDVETWRVNRFAVRTKGIMQGVYDLHEKSELCGIAKRAISQQDPTALFSAVDNPVTFWVATQLSCEQLERVENVIDVVDSQHATEWGDDLPAPGWYWQPCFPGCLPDGEPNGPFDTEREAIEDAQAGSDDGDESDDTEQEQERCRSCGSVGSVNITRCEECCDANGLPPRDERDEPGEEYYYLSSDERSILYLGKRIAGPVDADADPCPRDAVMRELAAYVAKDHYFPDVWAVSDHGNAVRISVLTCGCYFTEHDGRPELHEQDAAEKMLRERTAQPDRAARNG